MVFGILDIGVVFKVGWGFVGLIGEGISNWFWCILVVFVDLWGVVVVVVFCVG